MYKVNIDHAANRLHTNTREERALSGHVSPEISGSIEKCVVNYRFGAQMLQCLIAQRE